MKLTKLTIRKTYVEREFISFMVRNGFVYRFDEHYGAYGGYRFVLPVHRNERNVRLFINRDVLMVDDESLLEPLKRYVEQDLFTSFGYTFEMK